MRNRMFGTEIKKYDYTDFIEKLAYYEKQATNGNAEDLELIMSPLFYNVSQCSGSQSVKMVPVDVVDFMTSQNDMIRND